MKQQTLAATARLIARDGAAMPAAELKALGAELILLNGFSCGRVLAVQPTELPDIWQICSMQDGAMDALVTFQMDVRTGVVSRG